MEKLFMEGENRRKKNVKIKKENWPEYKEWQIFNAKILKPKMKVTLKAKIPALPF